MVEIERKCPTRRVLNQSQTKIIGTGEICTIDAAKTYGVFGKSTYFDKEKIPEGNEINVYDYGNKPKDATDRYKAFKKYALCSISKSDINTAYQNCALSTNNPWKTLDSTKQYCMLPMTVELPAPLTFDENKEIKKPDPIPVYSQIKESCFQRWYDWFTIPDFHLGNGYISHTNTSNITKCLKPCQIGLVPDPDAPDRCITKTDYNAYTGATFHYLPIPLILLLGSTKELFIKHSSNIMVKLTESSEITVDPFLYSNFMNQDTLDLIYDDIKIDVRKHIHTLLNMPFDDENIKEPIIDVNSIPINKVDKQAIKDAYEIAEKFYTYSTSHPDKFKIWKTQLNDISGYGQNSPKFHKQLLILKAACNVAFSGKSKYSTDYILYTLNAQDPNDPNYSSTEQGKPSIVFEITEEDKIKAISPNNAENTPTAIKKISDPVVQEKQRRSMEVAAEEIRKDSEGDIHLNDEVEDPHKYDSVMQNELSKNESTENMKTFVLVSLFIILFIVFTSILYIISQALWEPIATILNNMVLGCYQLLFWLQNLFDGKSVDMADLNLVKLQMGFLTDRINADNMKISKTFR
jgi:hypothetical protein